MAHIDKKTVKYLAKLCRIACSEEQEESLLKDMEEILSYIDLLNELNTEGVEPCSFITEFLTQTPLREDSVHSDLTREAFLKDAPLQVGGMIRVPPVLKNQ